jgi:hypothetical protein
MYGMIRPAILLSADDGGGRQRAGRQPVTLRMGLGEQCRAFSDGIKSFACSCLLSDEGLFPMQDTPYIKRPWFLGSKHVMQ